MRKVLIQILCVLIAISFYVLCAPLALVGYICMRITNLFIVGADKCWDIYHDKPTFPVGECGSIYE